ncbi:MAG: hypothetical protein ACI4DU_10710 [Lachnospiraceae bacterium]
MSVQESFVCRILARKKQHILAGSGSVGDNRKDNKERTSPEGENPTKNGLAGGRKEIKERIKERITRGKKRNQRMDQ